MVEKISEAMRIARLGLVDSYVEAKDKFIKMSKKQNCTIFTFADDSVLEIGFLKTRASEPGPAPDLVIHY